MSATLSGRVQGYQGRVEIEILFLGVADKVPVCGKLSLIAVLEVVQDDATRFTDAEGVFQEFDEILCLDPARRSP